MTLIRLLRIIPGTQNAVVSSLMSVVNLDDNPTYKCLSYTWGEPGGNETDEIWSKPSQTILINGSEMHIRQNLYNALVALCQYGILGPIWIDALCINQNDIEERNSQVSQVANIYKSSEEVIVWLGHEREYTQTAVACFQRLPITRQELLSDEHVVLRDKAFTSCNFTDSELLAMTRFFTDHAWFGRTWTLQEMWLARDMTFMCGTIYASVDVILAGSSIAHDNYSSRSVTEDIQRTPAITWLMNFTYDLIAKLRKEVDGTSPSPLGFEVDYHRARHATDPRDKVYGLLAISDTTTVDRYMEPVVADYSKSVQEVFSIAAAHCLLNTTSWRGLSYIGDRSRYHIPNLPSWVPDYTQAIPWRLLQRRSEDTFKTATHQQVCIEYDINSPYTIHSPCSYFDTITAVTTAYWEDIEGYSQMIEILNLALNPFPVKTFGEDNVLSVVARTLTADQAGIYDYDSYDFVGQFGQMTYGMLWSSISKNPDIANQLLKSRDTSLSKALFYIGIEDHGDLLSGLLHPYRQLYETEEQIELESSLTEYRDQSLKARTSLIQLDWGSASHKRSLFRTKKGHLGLAPQTIQVGDEVGILQGAEVPHVFRRDSGSETSLSLVGDAYVYGIMYGELESEDPEFSRVRLV
ncbi:heterokaryon incompatibility het-6 [Fusarium pseudocircinatum]|uniref:Heterokaryon incompatibility het-6 n=1 Tax=Fusarium pseudocircinatum TaxID=56676 RepID=A0A8H5PTD5_9HYPO|nr:heterokaryon incompatibility het-6 [Fusarium pseudocircinatum]